VDYIITNHLIEHLTRGDGKKLLKECYRVMKPDGVIRISTPDARKITKEYIDMKIMDYRYMNVGVEQAEDETEAYYNLLLEGHKTIYCKTSLDNLLKQSGFTLLPSVTPFTSNSTVINSETLTTHPTVSLVIEAKKEADLG
jgi:predicted SAM-dependent methyltransferase